MLKTRPCPKPFDEFYCFNGGQCLRDVRDEDDEYLFFCKCAQNFTGRRCEYIFDSDKYGFSTSNYEVETAALSTLVTLFVILIIAVCCLFYLYDIFGRENESGVAFPTRSSSFATAINYSDSPDSVRIISLFGREDESGVAFPRSSSSFATAINYSDSPDSARKISLFGRENESGVAFSTSSSSFATAINYSDSPGSIRMISL